jgi:hypothetical protein
MIHDEPESTAVATEDSNAAEPKPLAAPRPKERTLHLVLLSLMSALAGAAVLKCAQEISASLARAPAPPVVTQVRTELPDDAPFATRPWQPSPLMGRQFPKGRLGPGDAGVTFPTGKVTVVHVWLQGCSDCMPAFRAHRRWTREGLLRPLDGHVVNVAYGSADPVWARRFELEQGLVVDEGGRVVVTPLGIGTFTSMVVDAEGRIVHVDRPDYEGYAGRMVDALQKRL